MRFFRDQIESFFEALVHVVFRFRWLVICLVLLVTGILGGQIRNVRVDTSTEALFFKDDPAIVTYDRFREEFGSAEVAILAIQTPKVFTKECLTRLRNLHRELKEKVPYLDDITSLVNVTAIRGEKDELIIEELMKDWGGNQDRLDTYLRFLKDYAQSNPVYRNYLLSEDLGFTAILLKPVAFVPASAPEQDRVVDDFADDLPESDSAPLRPAAPNRNKLSDKELHAFVRTLIEIAQKYQADDFSIYLGGQPLLSYSIETRMQRDVPRFTAISVSITFLLLFILFRRPSGVFFPLIIVILSMISTLSLFGVFGVPFTIISQIIPSFIISVGVCDAVHLLAVFYRRYEVSKDKEEAIAYAMGHSGLAILMTSLTTAGGLISFAGAEIAPIADMGIFASSGVLLALLYTITLLPALVAVFPIQIGKKGSGRFDAFFDNLLQRFAATATRRPWLVIGISAGIMLISAAGISLLHFSHNPLAWFPETDHFPVSTLMIDHHMKGSMTMEAVVETGQENILYEPDFMNRLERFNQEAEQLTMDDLFVGKAFSVVDTIKQINKSLHENREDFYKIPQSKELIAQEMVLFENGGTDDLENLTDREYSKARITIKLPWKDANTYAGIQGKLIELLKLTMKKDWQITITGMISLVTRTIYNVIITMMESYLIAGIVITLMMIFLVGSFKYGLLSMIPNILPILISLGVMGFTHTNLDLSNILIGSIIIGLAVDDTVHFFHNFRRYFDHCGSVPKAVEQTLLTTGRAMLFTSLVLVSGFSVFVVSDMKNLVNFGLISSLAIVTALLADLLLAPALMAVVAPGEKSKRREVTSAVNPLSPVS